MSIKKYLFIPSWFPIFNSKGGEYFNALFDLYEEIFPGSRLLFIDLKPKRNLSYKILCYFLTIKIVKIIFIKLQLRLLKKEANNNTRVLIQIVTPFAHNDKDNFYLHLRLAYQYFYEKYFLDFDYISAQSVENAGLVAYHLHKKFRHLKYSITEHNYFSSGRFSSRMWPSVRSAFKHADVAFFCSVDKMRQVLAAGVEMDVNKRFVNYNYVKTTEYLVPTYKPEDELKIITVASASHFKDLPTLFETLNQLSIDNINYHFTLVGFDSWGNSEKYLPIDLIGRIKPKVTLIPNLCHKELMKEYEKNNLFLLTSIAEGMPVSLLEALELGLMCVITKHGGSEEVILNGIHGFAVDVCNTNQLSKSIKNIYTGNMKHIPELNKRRAQSFCSAEAYKSRTFLNL